MLILLFSMIFSLSSFANIYEGASKEKCTKEGYFKNGQCIEIDNHLLYAKSFGMPVGANVPNVIFLSGSGNTHHIWDKVSSQTARFAHVVIYDRSGYGHSQQYSPPKALTATLVVNNLITLLQKINVLPPYILVGHSHGGLFIQYFALTHPNMVRGMVLVDSSTVPMVLTWYHFKGLKNKFRHELTDPHYYELLGTLSVANAVKNSMKKKKTYLFNEIPIAVLTAENHKDVGFTQKMEKDWLSFQNQLLKTSRKSYQIIAYKSGHFIQLDHPNLVVDSIYTIARIK